MRTLSFIIFIMALSSAAMACEVRLPHHLLILSEGADLHQAIQGKNCEETELREIGQTLSGMEGKITARQLIHMLSNEDISLTPGLIEVQQFKQLVHEQLLLPPGVQLRSTQAVNTPNFVTLSPGDRVEVTCTGCLYGIGQPINVTISGFDGSSRNLLVRGDFKKMVKAFKFVSYMPAFSDIPTDALKEVYVESIPHTDLIHDVNILKFYKLNKPVKAGELLKQADLNAVSLVKAGLKTEVIIENALVRIRTEGISRDNGSIGDTVEVFHAKKNKKYQGKVVDINKVLVEL